MEEQLAAGPDRLSRRARLLLVGGMTAVVCGALLGGSQSTGCGASVPATADPSPWLGSDDPVVRDLHFGVLDRRRTRADAAPTEVLSADVARTTRRLGGGGGFTVYLADGPGFVCLGVDGRRAGYGVASQCLLDVSVVNQGLWVSMSPSDEPSTVADPASAPDAGAVLVVAVPDDSRLLTATSTASVARYANASVLRPDQDDVVLQPRGRAPVLIDRSAETTVLAGC